MCSSTLSVVGMPYALLALFSLSLKSLEMTVVGLSINERIREHCTIQMKLMGSRKPCPSVGLKKGIESLIIKG